MRNFLFFLACFAAALAVSTAWRPGNVRSPAASTTLIDPTQADVKAALPSQILIDGSRRQEELRLDITTKTAVNNAFGLEVLMRGLSPQEEAKPTQVADSFMGGDTALTFLGETRIEGRQHSFILQFRRDPKDLFGVRARYLSAEQRKDGMFYNKPAECGNEMHSFNHKLSSLELHLFSSETPRAGLFQDLQAEFPLRSDPELRGRIFALNRNTRDFEVIATVIWKKIPNEQAPFYVKEWGAGWMAAGPYRHSHRLCVGNVDQETFEAPPSETF